MIRYIDNYVYRSSNKRNRRDNRLIFFKSPY